MMSVRYDPSLVEEKVYNEWLSKGYFSANPKVSKKHYSIVIPPPNVTGALHLGHAINNTLQDILIRKHRMQGFDVLWIPGTDHAGIATQAVVEKRLFEQERKTRHTIGREALVKKIWEWKDEYEQRIIKQLKRMGCSCDWSRKRFTLDPICAKAVRHAFFKWFKEDLIFRGKRLILWDTLLQTAVSDDEIYHDTVKTHLWYVRYPVTDGGGFLLCATTRPETMLGDTAVAVHPEDERYKNLIGRHCMLPIAKRQIPIIADPVLVDMQFGSGCVKVTPGHDPNDYACALRNNLPILNILNKDGTLNETTGKYAGLDRYKARGLIIEELRQLGLIERVEDYTTDIAHSDRSKTPIEPMLSDQWFVRMSEIAQPALDAVKNGRIKFHPERYGKTFIDWLEEKRDWCISRQLWWGHRIPVWWVEGCNEEDINKAISEKKNIAYKKQDGRFFLCSANTDITQDFIKGAKIEQDPDVLDTWFSSALWPLATFGWPENTEDLKTYYPTDVLVTAREIITLWVARMVVCGLYNTKQIPFKDVVVHAVIQDGQGRPMKKSLGNGVDPEDIIAIYGCDALRFTLTHIATETQDVRLPVQRIRLSDGTEINSSKQFEIGRNFANKLWNVSRFVLMQAENIKPSDTLSEIKTLPLSDRWIISRMHNTIKDASYSIDRYHFNEYAGIMYNFVWSQFCDWYVEIAKSNTSNPYTLRILIHILDNILRLLHPSMPFITEEIWQEIKRYLPNERHNSIVVASWPEYYQGLIDANVESEMNALIQIITAIRNIRSSAQIPKDKTIEVIINIKPEKGKKLIEQNLNVILHLCKAEKIFIEKDVSVLGAEVRIIGDIEVYVPLMGIVDIEKQRQRLQKQHETTEKEIQDIQQRLKNPFFLQNADKQVISETKERLDILEQEREILQRNIKQLR